MTGRIRRRGRSRRVERTGHRRSGRPGTLELDEVHRFANDAVELPDGLRWDALGQYHEILSGLRIAARSGWRPVSIGVDTWGVDYGLLDGDGALIGAPFHYRDAGHERGVEAVHAIDPPRGAVRSERPPVPAVQHALPARRASRESASFTAARTILLMPDLIAYWLTGHDVGRADERVDDRARRRRSAGRGHGPHRRGGSPSRLFPPLATPGDDLGAIRPEVAATTGLPSGTLVTLVGSHDTASAVVGVPASDERFAYISCGTWSLVGVELDRPVLTEASRLANFTNEGGRRRSDPLPAQRDGSVAPPGIDAGVGGGGHARGPGEPARRRRRAAARRSARSTRTTRRSSPPGDMPARIEDACRRADQPAPASRPALVRCILDSLADAYARAVRDASASSGQAVEVVHLVGGGARNSLLCQLTADACEIPVVAGPVEATALGNVLVQARPRACFARRPRDVAALVRATQDIRRFEPRTTLGTEALTMRIALFITCYNDLLFPEVGQAIVRLLRRLGHEVEFPSEQTCCGQMHFNSGYQDACVPLVERFTDAFAGYDSRRHAVGIVRGDGPPPSRVGWWPSERRATSIRVATVAPRVHELSEFLVDVLGVTDVGARFPHTVAFHPTCHSTRLLGVGDRPTRLLQAVEGLTLVDLPRSGGVLRLRRHLRGQERRHVGRDGPRQGRRRPRLGRRGPDRRRHVVPDAHRRAAVPPPLAGPGHASRRDPRRDGEGHPPPGPAPRADLRGTPPFPEAARSRAGRRAAPGQPRSGHDDHPDEAGGRRRGTADWEELRLAGAAIKDEVMRDLPALLERLERRSRRPAATVHWARDAAEANAIVASIVHGHGATEVVKVKSMATQEIELNEALRLEGIDVWETDLAEMIVQLGHDLPSHILVPAIHRNRTEIRDIFIDEMAGPGGRRRPA